jgi:hypothetical protein
MSWPLFLRARECKLKNPSKALLMELAFTADDSGGSIRISVRTMSERTGIGERTVQNILRDMERDERIHRMSNGKGGRHQETTHYRLNLGKLPLEARVQDVHPSGAGDSPVTGAGDALTGAGRAPKRLNNKLKSKNKPSAENEKPSADPRHSPIREHIQTCFTEWTKLPTAPWNGRDAKALDNFLKANPSWEVETIKTLVTNRFDSEVNQADPAYTWLPQLQKYVYPLDKFGKPVKPRGYAEGLKYNTDVPSGPPKQYPPEVSEVVNAILPHWPKNQPKGNAPIVLDVPKVAARVERVLEEDGVDAQLLKAAAKLYLVEKRNFYYAPENFFGLEADAEWRVYARFAAHQKQNGEVLSATPKWRVIPDPPARPQ